MARRKTTETARAAAEAYAATLDEEAGPIEDTAPSADVESPTDLAPAQVASVSAAVQPAPEPKTAPRRDVRGRFTRRGARLKKGGRPTAGRRGPSYLANRRQEALVRMFVVLEHKVGRLEAELVHREWSDPVREKMARMKGIEVLQAEGQECRLAALADVLVDMDTDRVPRDIPKRHEVIAERMTRKLGEHFSWRTLYNAPYRSAWRKIDDALAKHAADDAATIKDRARLKKPMLVYGIKKLGRRRDELLPLLRARLLEEAADEDGWDPIPRRLGLD
jgi:hypothetical protein